MTLRVPPGADASDAGTSADALRLGPSRPAVSIQGVSKTYPVPFARLLGALRVKTRGPVEALREVSFDIREGEIFGLIGRNGAGKTTLTKIIATLVQPSSGHVEVCGFDSVRDEGMVRTRIGLATAEERSFYWRLTVVENLRFFGRLFNLRGRPLRQRINELLELLEMTELRRRRFGELSTGNKQRMAIARALLNAPPVLLLDEPTRSLDPLTAARARELIGSLAHGPRPVSILLTSHNLVEVEELCARVAVISRGRIRAVDTPTRLRTAHYERERVHIASRGLSRDQVAGVLESHAGPGGETSARAGSIEATFEHAVGDDALDRTLRALLAKGASIVSVRTEAGTLLDVLEQFESAAESEAARAAGETA